MADSKFNYFNQQGEPMPKLRCYICGVENASKVGDAGEHILPTWLFKDVGRQNVLISSVANWDEESLRSTKQSSFTVGCCVDCNGLMNRKLEEPLQRLLLKGLDDLSEEERNLIGFWMLNILAKLAAPHPKRVKVERSFFEWGRDYAIPLLRDFLFEKNRTIYGNLFSLLVIPMKSVENLDQSHDFLEYGNDTQTLFIRIKNYGIILTADGGFSQLLMYGLEMAIKKSRFFPNTLQTRELGALFAAFSQYVVPTLLIFEEEIRIFVLKSYMYGNPLQLIDASMPLLSLMYRRYSQVSMIINNGRFVQWEIDDSEPLIQNLRMTSWSISSTLVDLIENHTPTKYLKGSELLQNEKILNYMEKYLDALLHLKVKFLEIRGDYAFTEEILNPFLNRQSHLFVDDWYRLLVSSTVENRGKKETYLLGRGLYPASFQPVGELKFDGCSVMPMFLPGTIPLSEF